jgi:hypothetical protein
MLALFALCFSAVPLSAQTIWDGTADVSWYDASETSFDISTPEQLAGVAQLVNNGTTSFNGKTLNLTADLWLNSTGDSTNNWVPIGGGSPTSESPSTGSAFKGNFNGHGYAIYNLYCDKGSTFHAGLFCALENPCTIDSLVLYNPVLKSRGMMGCITGYPRGSSSVYIRHCLVVNARIEGENSNGSNNIGGICGATYPNSGSTYIQNCGVTGSITGYYPAGIAGNAERSYITNAYFAGTLFSYGTNFGGITAHAGNRTNCYSYTEVLSSTTQSSASSHGTQVTQAEMQSDSMITLLGEAFTADPGVNSGYPVLSYMFGIKASSDNLCAGESVTLSAYGYDSYYWSNGSTSETITDYPTTTTTYSVTGTLGSLTHTHEVTVTVYPQAVINTTIAASSDGLVHGTVSQPTATVPCGSYGDVTLTVYPDNGWRVASVYVDGTQTYGEFTYGPADIIVTSGGTITEVVVNLTDALTCTHVHNLSVTNLNGTNATVTWTAHDNGELSEYHVILHENATGVESEFTTDGLSYLLMGLSENTSYTVGVYTFCTDGYGSDTVYKNFVTPCNSPVAVTVGEGTANTHGNYFPTQTYYNYSYTQQIIPASQLNNEAQDFSSLAFQYFLSTSLTRNLDIYLAHVPDTLDLSDGWVLPSADNNITFTQVFSGQVALNNSGTDYWFEFPFSQSFTYNGSDNILVAVLDHTGSFSNSSSKFYTHNDANTANMSRYVYRDASTYDPLAPDQAGTLSSNVNNIRFIYCDMSSCIRPNTLAVSNVDASSAEISWFNPNSTQNAEIEYRASGETDWTPAGTTSGSTYTLYGLEGNTVYQVRVRALCGGNDVSLWTDAVSFRTECEALWELPYTQNFDGNDHYGSGEDAYIYCWDRYTNNPSSPVYYSTSSSAHSLSGMLRFDDGSNVTNIAIMPKVDESIYLNELQISFWVKNTSASSTAILELGVMTDKNDPTTFETLDTIHPQVVNQYNLIEYSLANYTGNGQYIAFRASNGNGGNNLRLDDVTLDYIPVCAHPVDLAVDAVTSETVTIHWSEVGTATEWMVEYGPVGFEPGSGTSETVYDTSHTIYGLNPNTEYDLYVWSDCGVGFVSTPVSVSFRTDCGPIVTLPYSENFETGIYATSQDNYILCWSRFASDPAHYVYVPSNTYAHSGTHFLDFHHTTNCYNIAIAPELDQSFDVSQLMVNFWACRTGSSGTLEVGVMTDKDVDSTFVPVDTIDLSAMNTYAYAEQFVSFGNYLGSGKYIAFRVSNAASCGYYIDDVTVDYEPSCSPISSLEVDDISGTSAIISWTAGPFGTVDSYTLEYSESGLEAWTTVDNITATTYLLGGLNYSTYYDVRVRPNCDNSYSGEWVMETFRTNCLVGGDVTIGDGTATNSYLPSYSTYNYSYTQQLFLAEEMGGTPRSIESVTFEKVAGSVDRTLKIYLMHTSETSASSWIDATSATLVFDTAQSLQNGFNTFQFSTPFQYNGADNLLLIVLDMTGSWQSGNTWRTHTAPFTASRYIYQDASAYSTTTTPSSGNGGSTTSRNNVIFGSPCDTTTTCVAPNINITGITSDGATVNWVPGYQESAWEMEYRPMADTNWVSMGMVTSMSEIITGLIANTAYKVRMRSVCGGGEYSFWSEANFTTACGAFTVTQANPWYEDFEGYTSAEFVCWETPITYVNGSSFYPYVLRNYGEAAHSGGNTAEFKGYTNMLVLPEFTNDIHELRMSFWATQFGSGTTSAIVGVISDINDTATFEPLGDAGTPGPRGSSAGGNGAFMGPFDFNNVQATSGRIALLYTGSNTSSGWNMDDFTVSIIPQCSAPAHNSVTVTNVTDNSAEVSFLDDDASHSAWVIFYREAGSSNSWSSLNVTSTLGNLLSGLLPNTTYEVYVATLCNGTIGDDQTNTVTFTTTTIAATLPYTTDFEDATDNLQWGILNGTQTNKWYIGEPTDATSDVNTTIGGSNGLYISNDGGVSNTYQGTETRVYAYRDILVPNGTTELQLSFDWKAQGGSNHYEFLRVYWLDPSVVNLTPGSNPPTVNGVNYDAAGQPGNYGSGGEHWLSLQSTWQHQEMMITSDQFPEMGNGDRVYRLVFHWRNTSYNSNPPAAVDNIELSVPVIEPCETPTNLAVGSITQNEATATWTPGGSESAWIVQYKAASATNWTPVAATVNSYTMTGLTANTQYQVRVQSACSDGTASPWTEPVTFTTLPEDTPEPCETPTDLVALDVTSSTITFTWTDHSDSYSWNIMWTWDATLAGPVPTSNKPYTMQDLHPNTTYTIRVQTICAGIGESGWSEPLTVTTLGVGIDDHLLNSINLFPNPANDIINVQCTMNNVQVEALEVFDVYGKLINTVETVCTPSLQTQINVSGLAAGMYFVRVTTEEGVVTKSFVKK